MTISVKIKDIEIKLSDEFPKTMLYKDYSDEAIKLLKSATDEAIKLYNIRKND